MRREDNTKAIYISTPVMVISLPHTFVSGMVGMNASDFRTMPQGQWLFLTVSTPLVIAVLVICFFILQYRFKLQRLFRMIFLWPFLDFEDIRIIHGECKTTSAKCNRGRRTRMEQD